MVFNKNITGYKNEVEFKNYLNGRRVKDLNIVFRDLFDYLYERLDEDDIIYSRINYNKQKDDLVVIVNGIKKKISIKKGVKNSVHVESIASFTDFLKENGISRNIIIEYLKFHFADGTLNGTGELRKSAKEYKETNIEKINLVNKVFNDEVLIKKAITRFILKGKHSREEIDVLIYGVLEDFLWISKENIKEIILSKKDLYSSTVHFSSLTVQPMNRCLNRNKLYEDKRFFVQIKWYNIADEIIESMNNNSKINIEKLPG